MQKVDVRDVLGVSAITEALGSAPISGIRAQRCGDAHPSNFGGFATPERQVIFAIGDLDETPPAPCEWDVKRLKTSSYCVRNC